MIVSVQMFARARDLAATDCVRLALPEGAHAGELKDALAERFPALRPVLPALLVAVNGAYATAETVLFQDAEIACFPPVSGG